MRSIIEVVIFLGGFVGGGARSIKIRRFIQIIKLGLDLSGSEHEEPLARTVPSFSKVVYKGFITLSARKAINFGVGHEAYRYA